MEVVEGVVHLDTGEEAGPGIEEVVEEVVHLDTEEEVLLNLLSDRNNDK